MSRYTSEQTAYSQLEKKYVPLWILDTNTMTITHFNAIRRPRRTRPIPPTSSGIIFISLTAVALTGFAGSSMRARSFSTSVIWNGKSAKLSPVR